MPYVPYVVWNLNEPLVLHTNYKMSWPLLNLISAEPAGWCSFLSVVSCRRHSMTRPLDMHRLWDQFPSSFRQPHLVSLHAQAHSHLADNWGRFSLILDIFTHLGSLGIGVSTRANSKGIWGHWCELGQNLFTLFTPVSYFAVFGPNRFLVITDYCFLLNILR